MLAIILVHYHTPHLLVKAVKALEDDIKLAKLSAEILVVDNGSTQAEQAIIKTLPVIYINSGKNLGYAAGINLGIANTNADFFIFMNPDVMVFPGCLLTLCQALNSGADAVGPRFYWDSQKSLMLPVLEERTLTSELITQLANYGKPFAKFARQQWRSYAQKHWLTNQPIRSLALSGALLATRKDVLEKVGKFDERFQLYFEEDDWLMRLFQKGLTSSYWPQAEALHLSGQSSAIEPNAQTWFNESAQLFKSRYYGRSFTLLKSLSSIVVKQNKPTPLSLSVKAAAQETAPMIEIPTSTKANLPLWIEFSSLVRGFPFATAKLETIRTQWQFPSVVWDSLEQGTYYLRVTDRQGIEIFYQEYYKTKS